MKLFIKPFLSLSVFLLFASFSYGQTEIDSTYQDFINHSWDKISASENGDSLQTEFALQHYDYFLNHRETETGRKAIQNAFMMWGNTGNAEMADKAMAELDNDSVIWSDIINSIGNVYSRNEKQEEFVRLMERKKDELTHKRSKSAAIASLVRHYKYTMNDKEKIVELSRELIDLNAEEYFVDFGKSVIYEMESLNIGQPAPDFSASTHTGQSISLSEQKGKVVLLEFWATWCGPCIPEIPVIKSIRSAHSMDDLMIIGIAVEEKHEKFTAFLEEKEMIWPQIVQDEQWDGELVELYNVQAIPQTYIIDREGNIAAKSLRGEDLQNKIAELIPESQ